MSNDFLTGIIAERETLMQERLRIDARIRKLDAVIAEYRLQPLVEATQGTTPSPGKRRRIRNSIPPIEVGNHARAFILNAGRPLTRGELLRKFDEEGIPIVGRDRAKVLGTTIWRLDRDDGRPAFNNTPRGYWPSDVPLPTESNE
ncbi:hypothetical protein Sa4125_39040 [Aureimonas sp. SA4125]|uniref:hypothetical protein n=1 Tax=Aureimonas sp. SA4125 TaxID=2826993 RepID=UPI001CC3949C|nr:hypothetical protein [Aureimonas sp. SA4125]BDA86362.1 hypothetical protein Sa4125_39040 [Aureimonas sp. SA4125]